jgi:hypothetical protein
MLHSFENVAYDLLTIGLESRWIERNRQEQQELL